MNNPLEIAELRKEVKKRIDKVDDTTVRMISAILEVSEQEAEESAEHEHEIQRRIEDYEKGRIVPLTFDDFKARAEKIVRKKNRAK
jgi:putative addiction module component (TIGR02574 family)